MAEKQQTRVGIIAPSSKVPRIELRLGVQFIREAGFQVQVHPQCYKEHLFFAGEDQERARAFFQFARDPQISALWCARGGHGALRLLPLLEKLERTHGLPPKKLLVGYSDATALMEFVRKRWGWSILHGPMPSARKFSLLGPTDQDSLCQWVRGRSASLPWDHVKLTFWSNPPKKVIRAPMVGGNLTVWDCLTGTPYAPDLHGKILFLEDVDESLYRLDRLLQHQSLAGGFNGIRAIVLGNFMNCRDVTPLVLKAESSKKRMVKILNDPQPNDLKPLRKVMSEKKGLREIFSAIGQQHRIPIAFGLPVGHGPEVSPLPLGATYQLHPNGKLTLSQWDWLETDQA